MASFYELNLVLRGRNYLSNDLRRASSDIAGLGRKGQVAALTNQRRQLEINKQRLASSKQTAQNELKSIESGSRAIALQERAATLGQARYKSVSKLAALQKEMNVADEAQVANQAKLLEVNNALTKNSAGYRSAGYAELKKQQEQLLAVDKQLIAEQVRLSAALKDEEAVMSRLDIKTQKLAADYAAAAARAGVLTDKLNTTNAALTLNGAKLDANSLAMNRAKSNLAQYGRVAESVGRTMQTFGVVVTAAFAAAAYQAAKFSTGGVLAATQLVNAGNSSPQNITRLGGLVNAQILKFQSSGQSVASAAEVQKAAYDIPSGIPSLRGSSVQKARETITLIKEFNKVTKANFGLVDLNGVTQAGIILINTFGTSIKKLPREFDVMQSAVNRGKVTLGEFVSGLSQTAPAAKAAGYNFDSMASTLSFLSGKLPQYTRVAVGYARALELFQNKKFEDYMKSKGHAITDLTGKLLPYNEIIKQILKVDPSLAKAGNLISFLKNASGASGFMQARRVLTVSLQDAAGLDKATHAVPANAKGLVDASATALSKTGAVKWKELTTQLKAFVIVVGQGAIPAFMKMASYIAPVAKWFNNLSESNKKLIGEIGAAAGVFLLLGGTFAVIVGMFARIFLAAKTVVTGLGMIKTEAGFVSARFALGLGIPALIILMIHFHKQTGYVVHALGGLKNVIALVSLAWGAWKLVGLTLQLLAMVGAIDAVTASVIALQSAAAAPIIVTVLLAYELYKNRNPLHEIVKTGAQQSLTVDKNGQLRLVKHTAERGPRGTTMTPLTPDQAAQYGKAAGNVNRSAGFGGQGQDTRVRGAGDVNRSAAFGGNGKDTAAHQVAILTAAARTVFNVKAAIANVEKLREVADRTKSLAAYTAYENARAALEKHFKGAALSALDDYLSAVESATKKSSRKTADAAKKAAEVLKQQLQDMAQNAMSMYDTLLQQNQSIMGQLFSGPYVNSPAVQGRLQYGGQLVASDYAKDARSQVNQFKSFYGEIGKLQKRGAPSELIQQLIQAGPSALPAIKALAGMGKAQWHEYIRIFNQGQKLLHDQTIKQLKEQLKDYRKYGNHIAEQIIAGMRDKRLGLANEIKSIIEKMFGVKVPVVHHAARTALVHAHHVAGQHPARQPHGTYTHNNSNTKPVAGTHTRTTQGVTEQHTHYHVVAPMSEHSSVKTQLRHAEFARKNRYRVKP